MAGRRYFGTQIRRKRIDLGLKQTDLARACDISPSYLNLIEHDRRPIGADLLERLAAALGVAPSQLRSEVEAGDLALLRQAAGALRGIVEAEIVRAEEFALRFPGWAALVTGQADRIGALERRLDVLADRLRQDPAIAASLHNILSTVTAIRSTASILVGEDPIEPAWQSRFQRNIHEESQRLADATAALVADLEESGDVSDLGRVSEAGEAWLGSWAALVELEPGGNGAAGLIERAKNDLGDGDGLAFVRRLIEEIAGDEAALPLAALREAVKDVAVRPYALADRFSARLPLVLRRLAVLPELGAGYFRTDAEGVLNLRRPVVGYSIPRIGASRRLWPLYAALENPGQVESHRVGGLGQPWERFEVWAVAETIDGELRGSMLVLPEDRPSSVAGFDSGQVSRP